MAKKIISGIYQIRNKINDKCYVGRSVNVKKRWKIHKNGLRHNKHHSIALQRAWNKYGEDNFEFSVIEECDPNEEVQILKEDYYKNKLDGQYSVGVATSGGDNISNHPEYDRIVKNIGDGTRKRFLNMTDEERENIRHFGNKNANFKNWSSIKKCPQCGTRIGYGHKSCMKCKDSSGENNSFYGKSHSPETVKLLSIKAKERGNKFNTQKKQIYVEGKIFSSLSEAGRELNMCSTTIRWRALSKNPKYKEIYYLD